MESQGGMSPVVKWLLIGCGGIMLLGVAAVVGLFVWIASQPESGVKLANEMDAYALEYLEEHGMLEPAERLLAYYDVTMAMDGSEAALVTDRRVMYHKGGRTTAIELASVEDVSHREEGLIGDVIEVFAAGGEAMKIEIAPLNGGATFHRVLVDAWQRARPAANESGPEAGVV